jgi:tRNA(adenine34) deaminase
MHQVSPLGGVGQHQACGSPMALAIEAARQAGCAGEVPVGAVVTDSLGRVLAIAGNRMVADGDSSAHAECLAMRMAVQRTDRPGQGGRLTGCDVWVTLEPCAMCAAAAGLFRVRRIIFGAYDAKGGGVEHNARVFAASPHMHQPEIVGGVQQAESAALLRDFFSARR